MDEKHKSYPKIETHKVPVTEISVQKEPTSASQKKPRV